MGVIDPTTVRLSDQFLLSDFMLCDSVARYGYRNQFDSDDTSKLKEATNLAQHLEALVCDIGLLRVSYGYISPELSRHIVKYQDPNKPSYHRFELGAAADIRFPGVLQEVSPIEIAWSIDGMAREEVPVFAVGPDIKFCYSRMITYSESEWICFATSLQTPDRSAFYENRYVEGQKKPQYIRYPDKNRAGFILKQPIPKNWRGQGYPSYHGGGRLQYQHLPVSKYTTYLDFLYSKNKVHSGSKNNPPLVGNKTVADSWKRAASEAGAVVDFLMDSYNMHFSVVSSYDSTATDVRNWNDRFMLGIVPPESLSVDEVVRELETRCEYADEVKVKYNTIYILGKRLKDGNKRKTTRVK